MRREYVGWWEGYPDRAIIVGRLNACDGLNADGRLDIGGAAEWVGLSMGWSEEYRM